MRRALFLGLVLGITATATAAAACSYPTLGERRSAASRIVEGRVSSVRIARVWVHEWKIQIDRVATVRPVATVRGDARTDNFAYRFTTHEDHLDDWSCSGLPDRPVSRDQTAYFLWEGSRRPTLALMPAEFRRPDPGY